MTWVVGYNPLFGHAYLISDIQITAEVNGVVRYFDCCQKIYGLSDFVGGGFAGSVRIGFEILGALQKLLAQKPPQTAWCLDEIASTWVPDLMRQLFNIAPDDEKEGGSQIILASAHPTKNRGDAPWAETQVATFGWPNFEPTVVAKLDALAIGSGAEIYQEPLKELANNFEIMQAITAGDAAYGNVIYHNIKHIFDANPTSGISSYYHVMGVSRLGIQAIGTYTRTFHPDGRIEEHRVPATYHNYNDVMSFLRTQFGGAAVIRGLVAKAY